MGESILAGDSSKQYGDNQFMFGWPPSQLFPGGALPAEAVGRYREPRKAEAGPAARLRRTCQLPKAFRRLTAS